VGRVGPGSAGTVSLSQGRRRKAQVAESQKRAWGEQEEGRTLKITRLQGKKKSHGRKGYQFQVVLNRARRDRGGASLVPKTVPGQRCGIGKDNKHRVHKNKVRIWQTFKEEKPRREGVAKFKPWCGSQAQLGKQSPSGGEKKLRIKPTSRDRNSAGDMCH